MGIEQSLALFDSRNKEIFPQVLGEGKRGNSRVYWPAQWHKRFLAQVFLHACVARIKVKGLINLYEAAALSEELEENQFILVSNHIADFDHPLKRFIFCKLGLKNFADRLVFPAGLKMIERPQIKFLMPGENALFVMTPFDAKDLADAKTGYGDLTVDQQAIIDEYEDNVNRLTKESGKEMLRLKDEGKIFTSYPEATRSRTGLLGPGQEMVTAHYPKNKGNVYIVPMMFSGIDRINPPEKMICLSRVEVSMAVGKVYPAKDIWAREEGTGRVSRGLAINRIMARLAVLEPGLVCPQDREFYSGFLNGYDPNIEDEYRYLPNTIEKGLTVLGRLKESLGQIKVESGRW